MPVPPPTSGLPPARPKRGRTWWRRRVLAGTAAVLLAAAGTVAVVQLRSRPAGGGAQPAGCDKLLGYLGAAGGSAPELATELGRGVRLAVERHTQRFPGCRVTLVDLDSGGDPAKAAALAERAAENADLIGMIGPVYSSEATAVFPVLDRAGLVAVTPSASQANLSGQGWRMFHRAIVTDTAQAVVAAAYIRDTMKATKVYVVDDGSVYGTSAGEAVRTALAGLVVGTARFARDQDGTDAVARIRASGADVVYYGGFHYGAGPLLGRLRRAGVAATLVGGEGIDSATLAQETGGVSADGTVATCAACQDVTDADFRGAFRARYSAEPTGYAAVGYDVANLFLSGMRSGALTRAAMLSYVRGYDGTGVAGRYRFTGTGDLAGGQSTIGIRVFRDGRFQWVTGVPG